MTDFRSLLYGRYVSAFKTVDPFDDAAALSSYLQWCRHKYLPLLDGVPHDAPILELGCGPGTMLEFLRRSEFTQARGIDVSREQIDIATRHGLQATVHDASAFLEETTQRFGVIVAIDFFEHFTRDELVRLTELVHGRLADGGRLIVRTPNGQGLFAGRIIHGDLTHLTIFTPGSLEQLLKAVGFDRFRFTETGPAAKNVSGAVRAALWGCMKFALNATCLVETGSTQSIWTDNFICCAQREGQPLRLG